MANTIVTTGNALTKKAWAAELIQDALGETFLSKIAGADPSRNVVHIRDELKKSKGDKITYGLIHALNGAGVTGDDILEGNEEAVRTASHYVVIDQLRHAVRVDGKMTDQRAVWDVFMESKAQLVPWLRTRLDVTMFNHLCGNTAVTADAYRGFNAITAPSTSRVVYPGSFTSEASITSSTYFSLDQVDRAVRLASTRVADGRPMISPVMINGSPKYVVFISPEVEYRLRTAATAGAVNWFNIQSSALQGGDKNNPIFSNALGEYHGCVFYRTPYLPQISSTTTLHRSVFCGAQAITMAFGRENSKLMGTISTKEFDYENKVGVKIGLIYGMVKNVFAAPDGVSYDHGVITMPSAVPSSL